MNPLIRFKQDWFNHPEWWFNTSLETDRYLTETYGHWLDENVMEYSWDWTSDTLVAWILLYDQLPRHVARVTSKNLVYPYLQKAIGLLKLVMEDGLGTLFRLQDFTGNEFGFLMLPLRHSYDCKWTYRAMQYMWKKIELDKSLGNHAYVEELRSFIVAAYKRCPMLPIQTTDHYTYRDHFQVFAGGTSTGFDWEKHQAVIAYTPEWMLDGEQHPSNDSWVRGWKLPFSDVDTSVLVSLSGGVDSMVLLWILKHHYPSLSVAAVFINYCNRSDDEEHFVRDWCHSLNITLYVRRLREIQRTPAMAFELRETYETYTRNVRFHAYHQAHAYENSQRTIPLVAMGHNQDDCFENILTNICQKQKYENLRGMTEVTDTHTIQFWRPMLSVPKHQIYHFAQTHTIPYLHDSTPAWSCRGKIRDIVRPTLSRYHSAMIPAFFHLSQTLADLTQYIDHFAKTLCSKIDVATPPVTASLTVGCNDYPTSIWTATRVWQSIFQHVWSFCPSHKSIAHLCDRMKSLNQKSHLNVLIKKGYALRVQKNESQLVFTFNASSL
jgi:tRNA(Ile)-lysidine synthetase-like protein